MELHARIPAVLGARPLILRITERVGDKTEALLVRDNELSLLVGSPIPHRVPLPESLSYLRSGDIVRMDEGSGHLRVVYRCNSPHNVLFFTERCNSRCLMCSQPPRAVDDGYLIDEILTAIPLMARHTPELCITGGEPTLLGERLIEVLEAAKRHLPETSLHMLSNGRLFRYTQFARRVAAVAHPDFVIGVPLYSDIASKHDFVVQAKGAFDETIRGLMNLARVEQRMEIRFVIHQQTVSRMPHTARFITRNLPFVDQVALMGLEMTGFTRSNLDALWIDPADYQVPLREAVQVLQQAGISVMVYNHQLCVLDREIWPLAKKSISDWKNIYMPQCVPCSVREQCGGFFQSAAVRYSKHIAPVDQLATC